MNTKPLILKVIQLLLISFAVLGFSSCGSGGDKALDEGIIEYDARPVDETHPLAGLAPSSATLKFKKDKFIIEMSTMGMFNTMIICNVPAKSITQMIKFLDIKQACIETEKDIALENAGYKLKIEETKETKLIAGYKCHRLKVTMAQDPSKTFDAYYTKDMGIDNVNSLSPYTNVKGMLMQYRVKRMGLEMEFTAKNVKKADVPDNTFDVPAYFKIVSKAEMQKFFDEYQ